MADEAPPPPSAEDPPDVAGSAFAGAGVDPAPDGACSAAAGDADDDDRWRCPICLDSLREPVVTRCGHAFCWPCITEWIQRGQAVCPCCQGRVDVARLIPIHGQYSEADTSPPRAPFPGFDRPWPEVLERAIAATWGELWRRVPLGRGTAVELLAVLFLLFTFWA